MTTSHRSGRSGPTRLTQIVLATVLGLTLIVVGVLVLRDQTNDPDGPNQAGTETNPRSSLSASPGDGTSDPTGSESGDSGATSGPGAAPTTAIVTPTDLEALVLRGADLPVGWRTLAEVAPATRRVVGACIRQALDTQVPHVERTEPFRQGADGAILASALLSFPTLSEGAKAYRAIAAKLARCPQTSTRALDISAGDAAVSATSTTALDLSFREGAATARGQVIVARAGSFVVSAIVVGATQDDLDVARAAMNTVLARVS